jgi:hypothetical protein
MSRSLADVLNETQADRDTVQQGLRLFLAEQTDLTPREMLAEMQAGAGSEKIQQFLDQISADGEALNQAALIALQGAWMDPAAQPSVRTALLHAKDKLPVIELGIIAIVAMYGMYRAIPAQPTKVTTIIREPGGKYTEITEEHEPFLPILSEFSKVFAKSKAAEG